MSEDIKEYYIVEHLWRIMRAVCLLAGTALWLYTEASPHFIMFFYILAAIIDQLHGKICKFLEHVLNFKYRHNDWE